MTFSEEPVSQYLNYDVPENKIKILTQPSFFEELDRKKSDRPLIILDEIHKYKEWKNYLKGVYDGYFFLCLNCDPTAGEFQEVLLKNRK